MMESSIAIYSVGIYGDEVLLDEKKFPCLGKAAGLKSIIIQTAGKFFCVPQFRVGAGRELFVNDCRYFSSEEIENAKLHQS